MKPQESPENQLRQYTLAKQRIGALLGEALQFFEDAKEAALADQTRALLVKLAEDRFNLAVVGQYKRGKSSLMNAVIGRDLLPTGLLPLTSAITSLCYGPQERVLLKRAGWAFQQEIPLSDLAAFVTEQGNPGNEKEVQEARVEIPSPFLRRGLHFVDTPGIGSSRQENTATTYAFLPEADAVIFVTSVEAPLSEAEEKFLQDVRQYAHKLFVVVNKVDLLAQKERDQVLDYIRAGLSAILGQADGRIHPLSARQCLEAKLRGDSAGVQQSGMEAFESTIAAFLSGEKSQVFLMTILERALRLLAGFESHDRQETGNDPENSLNFGRLRRSLETLRDAIQAEGELLPTHSEPSADAATVLAPLAQALETSRNAPQTGAAQPFVMTRACPICAAQTQAVFDFFVHWQYALSKEQAARRAFRASRGFCRVHTWQFQKIASPQGLSEGYAPLVEAAADELRLLTGQSAQESAARLETLLPTAESCPACQVLLETGRAQVSRFLAFLQTPAGREAYPRSRGLCLPHLQTALLSAPTQEVADFLLQEQSHRLEEIAEDMRSYVLKRDAIRSGLLNDNEEQAWLLALLQLAGERTALAIK